MFTLTKGFHPCMRKEKLYLMKIFVQPHKIRHPRKRKQWSTLKFSVQCAQCNEDKPYRPREKTHGFYWH